MLSLALVAYAFNIDSLQTTADTALNRLNSSAQAQGSVVMPLVMQIMPYLLLLPALILFYAVLSTLASLIGLRRNRSRKGKIAAERARKRPLEEFKEAAHREGVRPEFAYHAYLLLQPFVTPGTELTLRTHLEDDLHLRPSQIRDVQSQLLRATSRDFDPAVPFATVDTALELMLFAQRFPRRSQINTAMSTCRAIPDAGNNKAGHPKASGPFIQFPGS